jgi:hypothetical protein
MAFDLGSTIDKAANEWNIDPALLHAVSQTESRQQANGPDSSAGAMGPLQVMPGTAADMGVTNPRDPEQNVYAGAKYLSGLLDKYKDPQLALAAYNAGPGRVDDYLAGKSGLPAETVAYVPKVAASYASITGGGARSSSGAAPTTAAPDPSANLMAAASGNASAPTAGPAPAADPFSQLTAAAGGSATAPTPSPAASGQEGPGPAADPFSALTAAAGKATPPAAPSTASSPVPATAPGGIGAAFRGGLSTLVDGVQAGADGVANTFARGAAYVDNNVPALAGLDRSVGLNPTAATNSLDQSVQQLNQAHPNSPLYQVGKIGTDLAFTVPATGGLGAAAGAAGEALGVPTVANALAGSSGVVRGAGALASNALAGAAQGTVAAGLNAGASTAPIGQQLKDGALLGGALGAVVPAAVGAARGATSAALGGTISPETAALAQTARDAYGIPVQAGQISDSPFVRFFSDQMSKMPLSGSGAAAATQATAMNRAIASTFGETADAITPQVMQAAKTRLGQTFDNLATLIPVQTDNQLLNDLGTVESNAHDVLVPDQAKLVSHQISNVLTKAAQGNGVIDGDAYQALTAKGGVLDNAISNGDPGVRNFASQVKDALNDAMARSAPPGLAQQLAEARFQYKNLLTIAPLAEKAQAANGNVSPVALLQAVRGNFDNMAFRGAGPLGDLAAIGQRFMKPPPDSGTATRAAIAGGLGAMTPAGIAAFNSEPVSTVGAALGAVGTAAAGRLAAAYLRSPYAANRLIANGLAGNPTSPALNALAGNAGVLGGVPVGQINPLASRQPVGGVQAGNLLTLNPLAARQ